MLTTQKTATPMVGMAARHGLIIGAFVWIVALALGVTQFGADALAYWRSHTGDWYGATYGSEGVFVYSPAFGQAIAPLAALPWPLFSAVWAAILAGAVAVLRPPLWLLGLLVVPLAFELYAGNIHLLLAVAIVLSFEYPGAWAFVLLTKVTPGLGLLWFAVRREWRPLAVVVGVTLAIVALSWLLAPTMWAKWLDYVLHVRQPLMPTAIPIPLPLRLAVAVPLIVWGAWTERRWTVIVGSMLALPVLWLGALSMLLAIPSARRPQEQVGPRAERSEDVAREPLVTA